MLGMTQRLTLTAHDYQCAIPDDMLETMRGQWLSHVLSLELTTEYGCEKGLGAFSRDSDASPSCLPWLCPDGMLRISRVSRAAMKVPPHIKYTCRSVLCDCDESSMLVMVWDSNDLKPETLARHQILLMQIPQSYKWQR